MESQELLIAKSNTKKYNVYCFQESRFCEILYVANIWTVRNC